MTTHRHTLIILVLLCSIYAASCTIIVTEFYDNTYVNDDWNRRHEVARAAVEEELIRAGHDFVFHVHANVSDSDAAYAIMVEEVAAGSQLFICHNTRFIPALKKIAFDHPTLLFLTTPSVGIYGANNTYNLYGYLYQATWLGGIACGLMTKTNNVGVICPKYMRGLASFSGAFMAGAKYANPSVKVHIIQLDDVTGLLQERKAAEILALDNKVDCGLGARARQCPPHQP